MTAAPNTLDDLLAILPGLRTMRSMSAGLLRVLLDRKRRECTWCGAAVGKGRSTWCGDACVAAFKARCCAATARRIAEQASGGVCHLCGRDTRAAERQAKADKVSTWARRPPGVTPQEAAAAAARHAAVLRGYGFARGRFREVDHDPPVSEYGGLCEPARLRLLCGVCHDGVTAALAKRRKPPGGAAGAALGPREAGGLPRRGEGVEQVAQEQSVVAHD